MAECGTDTGYKAHIARGEKADDACKAAHARHERTPEARARGRARQRALNRLARENQGRFAALLAEERAKEAN